MYGAEHLAIIFLLSVFFKLANFSATADLFVSLLGINYTANKIFLALLILFEIAVAYLVIADYLQNKTVYYLILGLITAFLFVNICLAINGTENCGCFGAEIVSSPALSILKNILLIVALIYLRKNLNSKMTNNLVLSK